jgi:hypothetical protein
MINCVINELLDNEYPGRLSQYTMIFVLAGFLDAQDPRTSKHSRRVSIYSSVIGCRLNLSDEDKSTLRLAGLLHDIGKIGVQRALLHKPDRLTPDEINESGRRLPINWVADLPHHRTYRSVYGGSKGYTLLCRIAFSQTKVSVTFEPFFGQNC